MITKKTTKKTTPKAKVVEKNILKKHELNLPKIAVIGIGGSGKNATNYMIKKDVKGVKFIAMNTDLQDLNQSKAGKKIHIGKKITQGIGTGMDPEIGKKSALESKEEIASALKDVQMVFLTGGFGGGTGTGATPVVASIAKDLGILTIGIVTKPFSFEGLNRKELAEKGISELEKNVDSYIILENDKILETSGNDASIEEAFALSDEVLKQAVEGISELITKPGRINIDYADIKSVLKESGMSLIGIGSASGKDRAKKAAEASINSPLINLSTKGSRSVLFSISASDDLKMNEISIIADTITKEAHENAMIKFGTTRNLKLKKGAIKITVVASNFGDNNFSYSDTETFGIKIEDKLPEKKEEVEFQGEEIKIKEKKEKGFLASFIDLFKL